jgi:hypothetical protein
MFRRVYWDTALAVSDAVRRIYAMWRASIKFCMVQIFRTCAGIWP